MLLQDQISRFESLGDNCELGFVLRALGHDAGSLFKWARSDAGSVLSALREDLEHLFAFDALTALRSNMVLDTWHGIGWHTRMRSHLVDGKWTFAEDEAERRRIHAGETLKFAHLRSKFLGRLREGGAIFVLKANDGIPWTDVDAVRRELQRLAGSDEPVQLLEVRQASSPLLAGTVQRVDGRLVGWVRAFAPYEAAHEIDLESWTEVLGEALRLAPCPDWAERTARVQLHAADGAITLAFPEPGVAGAAMLAGGNEWCRTVGDRYRLHGPDPARDPASLTWTGVAASGTRHLVVAAGAAIPESIPLRLELRVEDAAGREVAAHGVEVEPGRAALFAVEIGFGTAMPLTVVLSAQATRPLVAGERSVVDIEPLVLRPGAAPADIAVAPLPSHDPVALYAARRESFGRQAAL